MMFQLKQVILCVFMFKCVLSVHNFPSIITKTSNQTYNLSSTAILTCHVRDLGDHHVTWFKYDSLTGLSYPLAVGEELFTPDQRYSISSYSTSLRDSYWPLEIYQLTHSDEGTYLCKISNRRASVSIAIHLSIQIPMSLSPTYLYVEPGSNVKLNCSIMIDNQTLDTTPINWHFISNQLNRTKPDDIFIRKKIMNNSLISYLIIQHAQIYHSGIWTCVYKRQRRTAKLIVDKDVDQHQKISALLSNNSNRHYASFLLFFIINILFL